MDITPFKGFSFTSRLRMMYNNQNTHTYQPEFYYNTEIQNTTASVSDDDATTYYYQWENFASYNRKIKKHEFTVMVGTALSEFKHKTVEAAGYPLIMDSSNYAGLDFISSQTGSTVGGTTITNRKASFFGRINYGKYAVYPGGQFETHLQAFTKGALKLNGKTGAASAIMPYYTISTGINHSSKNVGNNYNEYIINDLLRSKYGYEGVVCTDWGVTHDNAAVEAFDGKCWGVELLTEGERHYEVIKAGVDQFGGNNDKGPVLEAYQMWCNEFGEQSARNRFEQSAVRLLLNSFHTGLFENPYLDPAATAQIVGNPEFMAAGYDAQLKSVVMVKNHGQILPQSEKVKIYVPKRYNAPETRGLALFALPSDPKWEDTIDPTLVGRYYEVVDDPAQADFTLVMIRAPRGGSGYSVEDRQKGGNGYVPISLQYRDYTAKYARETSLAGGDPKENFTNRSYKGKTGYTSNESDLDLVINTKKAMGDKPVVVVVNTAGPLIISEFEPYADAILVAMGVQNQAVLDLVSGAAEPSGLLPMQLPANMKTVEEQCEDVPRDMECYTDADGNSYDFAFGLNWSGTINDERVNKYK